MAPVFFADVTFTQHIAHTRTTEGIFSLPLLIHIPPLAHHMLLSSPEPDKNKIKCLDYFLFLFFFSPVSFFTFRMPRGRTRKREREKSVSSERELEREKSAREEGELKREWERKEEKNGRERERKWMRERKDHIKPFTRNPQTIAYLRLNWSLCFLPRHLRGSFCLFAYVLLPW